MNRTDEQNYGIYWFPNGEHLASCGGALDFGLLAFVFVRADERPGLSEVEERLALIPEVQEVHHVAGEDCFLVKVRVRDTEALGWLLRERLGQIPTVRSTRTTVVLRTVKESAKLPVPGQDEESHDA